MHTKFTRFNKKALKTTGTTFQQNPKIDVKNYSTNLNPEVPKTLGLNATEFSKMTNLGMNAPEFPKMTNPFEDGTAELVKQEIARLTPLQKKCLVLFRSGAMSFGSIADVPHMTIAAGYNLMAMFLHNASSMEELNAMPGNTGPYSNSGEGGEFAFRNNTIWQSRIRQVASGRFGVDIEYLANAKEVQIKINQGAKPGKGGKLPGSKVNALIAKARNTKPGIDLLSPSPHHDIYSIEDLKQLIFNIKSANPRAQTSVKLVARRKIGPIVTGTVKTGANNISIAGPGGTGAATLSDKYELTHPWEYALAESHQSLVAEGLRDRVTLTVSGGLQTGLDFFMAILLGADYLETGTAMLVALRCVMAEVCHNGTCPTGIATTNRQNIDENFKGTILDVVRFTIEMAKSLSTYLERYGFTDPKQAVGRVDLLGVKKNAPLTNLNNLLIKLSNPHPSFSSYPHETGSGYQEQSLFPKILAQETNFVLKASNKDRAMGARLAYFTYKNNIKTKIHVKLKGNVTGQAFGWLAQTGHTYIANHSDDATGGSLNGGTLYLLKSIGNQTAYGATKGEIYSPFIGDRAGIRNSGAEIVAEWIGHMGANFMTGGYFLIMGEPRHYLKLGNMARYKAPILFRNMAVGPNFGAGFTGGVVVMPRFLYNELYFKKHLAPHCENIPVEELTKSDVKKLRVKIEKYARHIDSLLARELLALSNEELQEQFIKLDPSNKLIHVFNENREQVENNAIDKIHGLLQTTKGVEAPPFPTGLYKASDAKDACGTGVFFNLNRKSTRAATLSVLTMLTNMMHRGAVGNDAKTGDGCGIAWFGLEGFFQKQFPHLKLERNNHAIIALYVPKDSTEAANTLTYLSSLLVERGLSMKGVREVPVNLEHLGSAGQEAISPIMQCVVLKPAELSQAEFEKELIKVRLKFECTMLAKKPKEYPHIISASSYHVIYTSMTTEDNILQFFPDFQDENFKIYAGVPHSRFATNKLPTKDRIQPFANLANNGENNALETIKRALQVDPTLANILGVDRLYLDEFSDSHIMSVYIDLLQLLDYSPEKIAAATIHPCSTTQVSESNFYNIFAKPFEGPNASILFVTGKDGFKIIVVRDKNGFRPQRGMINKDVLYSASELLFSEMEGDVFDLDPGLPLIIDLEKGTYQVYEPSIEEAAFVHKQFHSLKKIPEKGEVQHIQYFSESELLVRKLQAGWNKETLDLCLRPLFEHGKESTTSMGNQVPVEALVSGSFFSLDNFLLADFSQVTNPALSIEEEKFYTSTLTFVGQKPHLSELGKKTVPGYLLPSPIIDNREFLILQQDPLLNAHSIPLGFDVFLGEAALKKRMQEIVDEALDAVRNGKIMIVLSDLNLPKNQASVPAVMIASFVDEALIKAGLREKASLVLQAGSLFTGPHMAKAISVGGVDLVNPYLSFIPSKDFPVDAETFQKMCKNYKEGLRQALLEFQSRLGISTIQAYKGSKAFSAYGLDSDIALSLGITSDLGGVGWQDIAQILLTNHTLPKPEGLGRYSSSDSRPKIWEPSVTQAAIKAAKSTTDAHSLFSIFENKANLLKTGNPRGWLRLKPPMTWSHENPMKVCILGAGAAGFYQVQSLLDSNLPVEIVVIEKNPVNGFGLIRGGIAQDHPDTKKQGRIFYECLNDPRVRYFGCIEVGKQVTVEELEKQYPVVIDCRGAEEDRKLGVIGEDLSGVLTASQVYKAYNSDFDPSEERSESQDWPFTLQKNPVINIIGQGNVASDLTRTLLKDADSLEDTAINPEFLRMKRANPFSFAHLFGIDSPEDCKMGLKELKELEDLGLPIIAYFDSEAIEKKTLTEHQKQLMAFFNKAHNNTADTQKGAIYFHFQMKPKGFKEVGKTVEALFEDNKGVIHSFPAGNHIIAIGRQPANIARAKYKSGWVHGRGGTLVFAENSAHETTEAISKAFFNGEFNDKIPPTPPQKWQLQASVTNQEQLNILRYLDDKNQIRTIDDFLKAKHYQVAKVETVKENEAQNMSPVVSTAIKDKVLFFSKGKRLELSTSSNSLVKDIQSNSPEDAPKTECDCKGKCGSCAVKIDEMPSKPIEQSTSEKRLLRGLDKAPEKHILSCAHNTEELMGGSFSI